jgi:hypothetical protein
MDGNQAGTLVSADIRRGRVHGVKGRTDSVKRVPDRRKGFDLGTGGAFA